MAFEMLYKGIAGPYDDCATARAAPAAWSDHAVEQLIGRLLQIGVLLAARS